VDSARGDDVLDRQISGVQTGHHDLQHEIAVGDDTHRDTPALAFLHQHHVAHVMPAHEFGRLLHGFVAADHDHFPIAEFSHLHDRALPLMHKNDITHRQPTM
jgi:hypothetical protein